jgi:hypothetical protein
MAEIKFHKNLSSSSQATDQSNLITCALQDCNHTQRTFKERVWHSHRIYWLMYISFIHLKQTFNCEICKLISGVSIDISTDIKVKSKVVPVVN